MQPSQKSIPGIMLALALALTGCASAGSSTTPKNIPNIALKSPALRGFSLPARYTCDGKDISPPLEWGPVPADTGSLALFVVGLVPEPGGKGYAVSVEWAVAGLTPETHKIGAGELAPGAYFGLSTDNQRRYSICPKRGTLERYQFELYGLPSSVLPTRNFAGLSVLSALVPGNHSSPATVHGGFVATYKRR